MSTTIYVDSDEWYPVYSFSPEKRWGWMREAEVSPDDRGRLEAAFKEFEWAQDFLESKYRNADYSAAH